VLLPSVRVVFIFFLIYIYFKPPFRFVHFFEFTEHLISVFWDCCSHFLCFCVCWFVTAFVIYFVCLCVCVCDFVVVFAIFMCFLFSLNYCCNF